MPAVGDHEAALPERAVGGGHRRRADSSAAASERTVGSLAPGSRGFSLGVAGLVIGTVTGLAVVAAPVVGPVIDRVGARDGRRGRPPATVAWPSRTRPGRRSPPPPSPAPATAGWSPASPLVASLVPPRLRHRATAVSRVAGNLGMGLGGAVGGLVAAYGLYGFVGPFLANACSYVLYVVVLVAVVPQEVRPPPVAGGYQVLLRDRPFVRLALTNIAVIAVGWGAFTWIVPPYARDQIGVGSHLIGLLLFANALAVVLAQLPVAKPAEGRRRAIASVTFAGACLLVVGRGSSPRRTATPRCWWRWSRSGSASASTRPR